MRTLSGNHKGWLNAIAKEIREAGKPVSLDFLQQVVPSQFATATNDGHVTAAENGLDRNDYRAGQRIWVGETVTALRKAKLVDGPDEALAWASEPNGIWKVRFGRSTYTIYGRAESAAARDEHMLGSRDENTTENGSVPGYLLKGYAEAEVEVAVGIADGITKGRHVLQVHPLAFAIPPMSRLEQEQVRADIEKHGVRMPLVLYPDAADKTVRGKPKLKVLDGRHRLQFASALGKPVRVEMFRGDEQEARDYVASLNLHRRNLNSAQRALAIERLYGEQARAEAKKDRIRKADVHDFEWADPTTQKADKAGVNRWENRALKMAGGSAAGTSARAVRTMGDVAKAPKTAARVDAGEIATVTEAAKEAAKELDHPTSPNVWNDTVRSELGRARGHMRNVLGKFDLPVGTDKPAELVEIAEEIKSSAEKVLLALKKKV